MNLRIRLCAGAAAALFMLAPFAHAQSVGELDAQLVEVRRLIANAVVSTQRLELLARSDELRKRLIAAAPADIRVTTWWAERSAAALEMLAADGTDSAVLFGIPTDAQRERARVRAKEAFELAARADQAAAQSVARLEAQLVDRSTDAATREQADRQLATLVDVEQSRRIPYLRATARMVLAASSVDRAGRSGLQVAAREFAELPEPSDDTGQSAQRLAVGVSAGLAALASPDRAVELRAASARQLRQVIERCAASPDAGSTVLAARARLALCRIGEDPGAVGVPAPGSDALAMEAEARAALLVERASAEPLARTELFTRAIGLVKGPMTVGTPAAAARACETIAAMLPSDVALESLPAEATLARAIIRAREDSPSARTEAIKLMDQVAARTDATSAVRSLALWEKAVLVGASGDTLQELNALAAVYRAGGKDADERAVLAARRAVDLFAAAKTPDGLPEAWKTRQSVLRDALEVLAGRDDGDAPRVREQLARVFIADLGTSSESSPELITRAKALMERLASESPTRAAVAAAIADAMLRQIETRQNALVASAGVSPASAKLWTDSAADAAKALAFATAHAPQTQARIALALGEAMAAAGDPQAAVTLGALVGSDVDRPETPAWGRLRLALARAQRQAGDIPHAVATLREITDKLEGAPGSTTRAPMFWQAWGELLSIFQSANADGSRTSDIRVQIRRLELLDPSFGGQPHARRIEDVRAAVGTD